VDKTLLRKWQSELEANLVSVEKQLSGLEIERQKIRAQLGALATLLPATEGEIINQASHVATTSEADSMSDFLSNLKKEGWSIIPKSKRQSYIASRKGQSVNLWFKFSRLHEFIGRYWFGINPKTLEEMSKEKGGVILLLGTSSRYFCFTFTQLQRLLNGATETRTGQKFHIREHQGRWELLPAGTGEWTDITRFYGTQGLREIGLGD
jgi:hypothetical protein